MELVLTRIDSRLIHGQVATSWVKATKPEAIFAVNDDVAEDVGGEFCVVFGAVRFAAVVFEAALAGNARQHGLAVGERA